MNGEMEWFIISVGINVVDIQAGEVQISMAIC